MTDIDRVADHLASIASAIQGLSATLLFSTLIAALAFLIYIVWRKP